MYLTVMHSVQKITLIIKPFAFYKKKFECESRITRKKPQIRCPAIFCIVEQVILFQVNQPFMEQCSEKRCGMINGFGGVLC